MSLLRRLLGRDKRPAPDRTPPVAHDDLEKYFTDADEARGAFAAIVGAETLPKKIFVVHGVGAVGKSSLLRMFRLHCRRAGIPVALTPEKPPPSPVVLLAGWADDLRRDGIELPAFDPTLQRLRELEAKVHDEAKAAGHAAAVDELAKTALAGAGRVVGEFAPIPFGGEIGKALAGEAGAAVIALVRETLSKPDLDFVLDPVGRLTDDFVADVNRAAERRRVVLMIDTYEQLTAFDEWLCALVARLSPNTLVVVAGRVVPDWDPSWPGWLVNAELIELGEMSEKDVADLVRKYAALHSREAPSDEQVQEVVQFARGLPMVAVSMVEAWARYRLAEFEPARNDAVADLADRLLTSVPAETRPSFEAAALLRSFNADSLRALVDGDGAAADRLYEELRRWPFTRPGRHGLSVHESMREVMNEALRLKSPQRFGELHQKAAAHYQSLVERTHGDELERLRLEWLYHAVAADEEAGMRAFRDLAEQLVRNQWLTRLRSLLGDARSYTLQNPGNRAWIRYYEARLEHLLGRVSTAEAEYAAISDDDAAPALLRAYALCDLGTIYAALDRLAEPGGEPRADDTVKRSLALCPQLDRKLVTNHETLMNISNARTDWNASLVHVRAAREFAQAAGDAFGAIRADLLEGALFALQGDWHGYLETRARYVTAPELADVPALEMQVSYFTWPLVFMGRCREAQRSSERAHRLALDLGESELLVTILESVALARGLQDDFGEARAKFDAAENVYENVHAQGDPAGTPERYIRAMLSFRGLVAAREGKLDDAQADLERALAIKQQIADRIGIPEVHAWLGTVHELRGDFAAAEAAYEQVLALRAVRRQYFEAVAVAGLARVDQASGRPEEAAARIAEAESNGGYEYDDVLASLRYVAARLAWDGALSDGATGFEPAERLFREALVHALRYNRFLLDELVGGRPQGSVFRPLTQLCADRGDEGRRMLQTLEQWWRTGTNAVEREPKATVSPLEVGISLVDAEQLARSREPGAGAPQRNVVDQLGAAGDG
ncbi:MAG: tetratricopeptide repeat protein [Actinomycetota bacterium]|nr:tetratricopeptide repeat protein [Actinomycetota bacterium]